MACGRPVIATDIGPIPELVRHEETGWLTPRDDADSLAETVLTALCEDVTREAYGREGRRAAERYSLEKILPYQMSLYESLL